MIKKDLLLFIKDKKTVALMIILIAVGLAGVLWAKGPTEGSPVNVGIIDREDSNMSRLIKNYITEATDFNIYTDENTVKTLFDAGELDFYLEIPDNFTSDMIKMKNTPLTVYIDSSQPGRAALFASLLEAYSQYITAVETHIESLSFRMRQEGYENSVIREKNEEISWDLALTAIGKDKFFENEYAKTGKDIPIFDYIVYSILILLVLYYSMLTGRNSLTEYHSGTGQRLRAYGIGTAKMVLSNTLVRSTFLSAMFGIVIIAMKIFGNIYFPALSVLFIIGLVYFSGLLFSLGGVIIGSAAGYSFISNIMILVATIMGGGIIPVKFLPAAFEGIAQFMPCYRFIATLG